MHSGKSRYGISHGDSGARAGHGAGGAGAGGGDPPCAAGAAGRRARVARKPARTRQDPHGQGAGGAPCGRHAPHPVHARPAAGRHYRRRRPAARGGGRASHRVSARAAVRQPDPGRRDQSGARESAVCAARSHGGAAGDRGRRHAGDAGALHGAGHAESDRAGGNLSLARSADGPLSDEGAARLPRAGRRNGDAGHAAR